MTVVTIAGDNLVTFFGHHLHAHHNSLLADVEMAETANQAHAIHLAGLFLETPDEQHFAIGMKFLITGEFGWSRIFLRFGPGRGRRCHVGS